MYLRKLVLSNLVSRKTRVALTIAAVALSVSLVVSVTSGYASLMAVVNTSLEKFFGSIDAQVSRQNDPHGPVSVKVIDGLRADPMVKRADGRIETVSPMLDKDGNVVEGRMATVIGIDRPTDTRISNLRLHDGKFFDTADGDIVVIDQALAEQFKLMLGDTLGLAGPRKLRLKVVGIVHKPEALAQHMQTVYVPLKTVQRFVGWDESYRVAEVAASSQPATAPAFSLAPIRSPPGPQVSRVYIELAKGVTPTEFERAWKDKLSTFDPAAKLRLTRDVRSELDKNTAAVELLSYLGGTVSMLAATFIVFSTLSMGVTERQRTLAMLRAVGATRWQIGELVIVEGMLLACSGAILGVPLGWLWVKILALLFSDIFSSDVVLSWGGVALGAGGSILAAMVASILPAWQATRVSPLEAMAPDASPPSRSVPLTAAIVGTLLIAIDPLLFFGPVDRIVGWFGVTDPESLAINIRFVLHFGLGLPGVMVGFFLVAPAVVKLVEAAFSGVVARAFGLQPQILRQQLSTGLWRAAGTAAALMVGLATLVVMQVQGNSSLKGWKLPVKFPDLFIVATSGTGVAEASSPTIGTALPVVPASTQPGSSPTTRPSTEPSLLSTAFGLFGKPKKPSPASSPASSEPATKPSFLENVAGMLGIPSGGPKAGVEIDRVKILEKVPGIRHSEIMPIAIASPQFGHGMTSIIMTAMNPEATMFFGIDPTRAFKMMELEFREGTTDDAAAYLDHGEALRLKSDQTWRPIDELIQTRPDGTKVARQKGMVFDNGQIVIQGIVSKPSADRYTVSAPGAPAYSIPANQVQGVEHGRFLIVTNEFKQLKGLGLGDSFALKRIDNRVVDYTIVGVVWSPGIEVIVSVFDMGRQFDQRTASSVFGSVRDARDDFGVERIYLFAANLEPTAERDTVVKAIRKTLKSEGMTAGDVRQIKEGILTAFNRVLLLASTVAFAALAVASLGVTNTVMASIRTRRWQFGVMRSIGVTRSQLLRLILAEAVLLGLVATLLGLMAGGIMAADAHVLQVMVIGYDPPVSIPWDMLGLGVGIVLFIALASSVWPAVTVALTSPLTLLQAGRAST